MPDDQRMKFALVPLTLAEANDHVERFHRHHGRAVGHKFSLGAAVGDEVVAVAIVGRPTARRLDDGWTLEVTRLCADGTPNACSFLYSAAWRAAKALGYKRLVTFTLKTEPGSSLRAAGWRITSDSPGRSWNVPSRPRVDSHPLQERFRWEPTGAVSDA